MSEEDEKKPVFEVTEEAWEEDTEAVDILEQGPIASGSDAPPSAPADTQRSGDSEGKPPVQLDLERPALLDLKAPTSEEMTSVEELPESESPIWPPSLDVPTSDQPMASVPLIIESNPPPSIPSVFPESHGASLSVGQHFARARRVGTGIWYAGVFLWSYLIVGEFVVGAGVPEVYGWSAFVGLVVGTFLHGANRVGVPTMWRLATIAVGTDIVGVLLLSSLVGSSRRSTYQALSLGLLFVAVGLIFWGIRFSRGGLPRPRGAPGINWPRLVLWALFAGPTLLIGAAFLS